MCDNKIGGEKIKTIYIDILLTVNIFVDFFLILCVKNFLHLRVTLKRMILGSIVGGAFSLVALFPALPFGLNIALDIIFACIISFVSFGKSELKVYIKRVVIYFVFSFLFCGIMIFIYTAFKPRGMEIYNDVVYFNISPIILIILTLVCYYILKLIKRLTKGVVGNAICCIEVTIHKKEYIFNAKVDTGCNVKEPFSGKYVIIVEQNILSDLNIENEKYRIIPFDSLGGSGIIKGILADKIIIDGKLIDNVYLGVCNNAIKGEIKSLIPYEIIENK